MTALRLLQHTRALALGCLLAGVAACALAGDFSVSPIRIFLDKDRKADVVTVRNNGAVPLQFEIRPKAWTQNAAGEDVYSDTKDLLVFPRLMALKAGEERDIRVGMRIPPGKTEKTYRVYITELPRMNQAEEAGGGSANVGFLINFGAPVFFSPLEPKPALDITRFDFADGRVSATVANTGNVHVLVEEMAVIGFDASGTEVYRTTIPERYLLAGHGKSYTQDIGVDECQALAIITYSVRTDKLSANAKKDVDRNSCNRAESRDTTAEGAR